jgi:hypothetical protein
MLGRGHKIFFEESQGFEIFTVRVAALRMILTNFHCHETKTFFLQDISQKITLQILGNNFFQILIFRTNKAILIKLGEKMLNCKALL